MNKLIPLYLYKLQQPDNNENCKDFKKLKKFIMNYSKAYLSSINESIELIKLNKEREKDE